MCCFLLAPVCCVNPACFVQNSSQLSTREQMRRIIIMAKKRLGNIAREMNWEDIIKQFLSEKAAV